jgi:hypothetical protein
MIGRAPPPLPPPVTQADGDGLERLRFHLWQVWLTFLTVLVTAWICTLGTLPAILAIVTAKHILVALLMMGLESHRPRQAGI